jgi:CDGSH-type Zn-finger protein
MQPDDAAEEPSVEVTDGPYRVTGLPLLRRRIVKSERGESLVWETVEHLEVGHTYYLCRCGGSSNKPFCDGSHNRNGFDGPPAPDVRYDERARPYEATGLVVRDDRSRCAHAGFCASRLTNVWKQLSSDAVADTAVRSHVMAAVSRCPSGALTFRLTDSDHDVEDALLPAVSVVSDGPLFMTGAVRVTRSDGSEQEIRQRVTLCRCGASGNKPWCDGSHAEVGFTDPS